MRYLLVFIVLFLLPSLVFAQKKDREPIQFSGLTLTTDSIRAVSYVNIVVKNKFRGTISDNRGFFSFVVLEGDTVQFTAIGYKPNTFIIPSGMSDNFLTIFQLMDKDTIMLSEALIYPWPSKAQFKEAFLALNVSDDSYEIARKNLQADKLYELSAMMGMDANENQKYYMQQQIQKLYFSGGQQPINFVGSGSIPIPSSLTNPLAWQQFIRSIKNGDLKKK